MKKLATLSLGVALTAFTVACERAENTAGNVANSTANIANSANLPPNMNGNNVPSNVAVVTNNDGNMNTAGVTTTGNYNYNVTRADFDKNANAYTPASGETIGQGVQDRWIHMKVRGAMATTDELRESTINVDVDNAVVTLRGSVRNAAQKQKAVLAAKVDGVKSVTDRLQIKPNENMLNTNTTTNTSPGTRSNRNQ